MNAPRHTLEVPCNPYNPVLYLACCGLLDLLARVDPNARGYWHAHAPTAFHLDSALPETGFLGVLLNTFCEPARWKFLPEGADDPTRVSVTFAPGDGQPDFTVVLDWWYETADLAGAIADKSAWKMYAGQMTMRKVTADMVATGEKLRRTGTLPATLDALLACEVKMSGRFGFDPRSSRNALNVGFSYNNLSLTVETAPFAELLAVFGLASFFPARAGRAGRLGSCRGWQERQKAKDGAPAREPGFQYYLWQRSLPVALARRAASDPGSDDPRLFSVRVGRGQLSNLTFARTTL